MWFLYAMLKMQNMQAVAIPSAARTEVVRNSSNGINSSSRVTRVESRGIFPSGKKSGEHYDGIYSQNTKENEFRI